MVGVDPIIDSGRNVIERRLSAFLHFVIFSRELLSQGPGVIHCGGTPQSQRRAVVLITI